MPDRPSEPRVPPALFGRITRISVTYTVNTSAGPRHTFHTLEAMRQHVRPEREQELIDECGRGGRIAPDDWMLPCAGR
jgi:hypothetical protein